MKLPITCRAGACDKPVVADGLCQEHFTARCDRHMQIVLKQAVAGGTMSAVAAMLDALRAELNADLENGVAWMNDANAKEFAKKYPRFVTLFNYAERIDWMRYLT